MVVHYVRHACFIRGILGRWVLSKKKSLRSVTTTVLVGFRGRSKHVEIKPNSTYEYLERGEIDLKYASNVEQIYSGRRLDKVTSAISNEVR